MQSHPVVLCLQDTTELDFNGRGAEEMPSAFHNDANAIRNLIVSLNQFSYVSITWERDNHMTAETGETCGEWEVSIDTGRRQIRTNHTEITNALWYVTTIAEDHLENAYNERKKARESALAKLTPDELRILGISR